MIHTALAAGISWGDIGDMSHDEVMLASNAKQAQNKEFAQLLAWTMYNGAALFSVAMNDPKKFPKLEDAFPSLFEKKNQQDWWIMKERMEEFSKGKGGV